MSKSKPNAEDRLPRTFMSRVRYQLTIKAFESEWIAYYEWGADRFGGVTASGNTIEEALNEMLHLFEEYEVFQNVRHLLK